MASKHNATILVDDSIVRISGYIINELDKGSIGIFGGISLLLDKIVDTDKEFFYQQLKHNRGGRQKWIGRRR